MSRITRAIRRFPLLTALCVGALLATAAPVAATFKTTSAITGWNLACFQGECWSGRGNFFAKWDRSVLYEEGSYYYHFATLQVSAGMEVGDDCPINVCTHWSFTASAQFKNSAGTTLSTIFPSGPACYAEAWPGDWVVWGGKCKTNFDVPYTATQVKVSWLVQAIGPDNGVTGNWSANRTVAI